MSKKEHKQNNGEKLHLICDTIFSVAVCITCFPYFVIMSVLANRTIKSYFIEVCDLISKFPNKE